MTHVCTQASRYTWAFYVMIVHKAGSGLRTRLAVWYLSTSLLSSAFAGQHLHFHRQNSLTSWPCRVRGGGQGLSATYLHEWHPPRNNEVTIKGLSPYPLAVHKWSMHDYSKFTTNIHARVHLVYIMGFNSRYIYT